MLDNIRIGTKLEKNEMCNAIEKLLLASASGMLLLGSSFVVAAEDDSSSAEDEGERVTIIGTRRTGRTYTDTPAPVDVFDADLLKKQGFTNMNDMLSALVPSFNVQTQGNSGTASSIRPISLRGISPDNTMILVNGKKRHKAAVIVTSAGSKGGVLGSQGADISTIPAIALKQVQVLRDGAAAQYGSSAVAGVINFVLDDSTEGGRVEIKAGSYYEGDGDTTQLAATYGTALGNSGHLNISTEFANIDGTSRTTQRADAQALIDAGSPTVAPYIDNPVQIWGTPEISDDMKLFLNMSVEAGQDNEFYAFGGYAQKRTDGTFYYRNPNNRGSTFNTNADSEGPNAGSQIRLVGDLTPEDGFHCAGGYNFDTGIRDEVVVGTPEDTAAIAAAVADPNCWVFNEMFPGGFTPFFGSDINDASGSVGFRGENPETGFSYDISLSVGRSEIEFDLTDSVNASLGPATPLFFKAGSFTELEKGLNIDVSYPVQIDSFASDLNVAAGFEWRDEQFEIGVAGAKTFEAGILGNPFLSMGINQGFEARLNGFAPFRPEVAGKNNRQNIALYLDLEADVTDDLVLGVAIRYEDFSDFGSTSNAKFSAMYRLSEDLSFRSTISTGFRAPSIGQQNFTAITTKPDADGVLVSTGTVPPTSDAALMLGGKQLQPEEAENFSLGLVYDVGTYSVTVDYFNIDMEDRITFTGNQTLSAEQQAQLEADGFAFAGISSIRFFTNDFDSTTQGVDIVATFPMTITNSGESTVSIAGNWTDTEVTSTSELLGDLEILQIEKGQPSSRFNATLNHSEDSWRLLARVNYYGGFTEAHENSTGRIVDAGATFTVDAEFGYNVTDDIELVIGAQNLLDEYPEDNPYATTTGATYLLTSPQGFNGGFYYMKANYSF